MASTHTYMETASVSSSIWNVCLYGLLIDESPFLKSFFLGLQALMHSIDICPKKPMKKVVSNAILFSFPRTI